MVDILINSVTLSYIMGLSKKSSTVLHRLFSPHQAAKPPNVDDLKKVFDDVGDGEYSVSKRNGVTTFSRNGVHIRVAPKGGRNAELDRVHITKLKAMLADLNPNGTCGG